MKMKLTEMLLLLLELELLLMLLHRVLLLVPFLP